MLYRDHIEDMKKKWIGSRVLFDGMPYTVVDVDYNGGLLINKKAKFTDTTAVLEHMVKKIGVALYWLCVIKSVFKQGFCE